MFTDRGVDKEDAGTYIVVYYKNMKNNKIMPFATWKELEIILCKSKWDRKKNIWYLLHMKSQVQINLYTKQKFTHRHKQIMVYHREKFGGRDKWKFGFRYTYLYGETDNQQYILYNTGNFTQHFIITYKRKESQKYVCIS